MDWRSTKFDWNHARAFLVTVEEGSLSAAARALGMSQPTLGRQVSALEQELGVALFERNGHGLAITPQGQLLLQHVRTMYEAANDLSLAASGHSDSITGSICISASEVMAIMVLPPLIHKLKTEHPGVVVDLIVSNKTSDLKRREADIAIRSYRPTQPDLIARKLGDINASLYATPNYLKTLPQPINNSSLSQANYIGISSDDNSDYIDSLKQYGLEISDHNFCINTDNHMAHWELTKQGMGLGVMPTDIGDKEPLVTRALANRCFYKGEMWLVCHRELRMNTRVRTVFDFLTKELASG